ncbi:MAG: hypothetical protein HY686_06240 [Chloroflexi bacterium]|nr:hypothetical protein [Chloroflexota bacterium]
MKPYEQDDPMELVGVALPEGDPDQFLESIVQEYLMLGWSPEQIMQLFHRPFFVATHALLEQKGEAYIQDSVERLAEAWSKGWSEGGRSNA